MVAEGELEAELLRLTNELARIPREALALNKASINKAYDLMGLRSAVDYNLEVMVQIRTSESAKEFDRLVREKGLREALNIRDSRTPVDDS